MTNAFAKFKEQQKAQSTDALLNELNGDDKDYGDDRFYYPERDKAGNASVVIRFLPTPPSPEGKPEDYDSKCRVEVYRHNFQHNGQWFIHNCLTTRGDKNCPVCESNDVLWKSGPDGELIVRGKDGKNGRKRRHQYVTNIMVVKDSANPENNGKVFLFQFGKKIKDKIESAYKGDPNIDIAGYKPEDLWEGANFALVIKKEGGHTNYDDSKFMPQKPIVDVGTKGDVEALQMEAFEKIWMQQYSLRDYLETLDYGQTDDKSAYDAQKARLDKVLGETKTKSAEDVSTESVAPQKPTETTDTAQSEDDFFDNI